MRRLVLLVLLGLGLSSAAWGEALTVHGLGESPQTFDMAALEKLGPSEVTDSREITTPSGRERVEIVYRGVELAKLLEAAGIERLDRHGVRAASVIVVARDGYRASFSWGELFNTAGGRRVFVITGENGKPNSAREGVFGLRSFGDLRPGPRHVRDVAELRVEMPR
jgi:hypothetical protein